MSPIVKIHAKRLDFRNCGGTVRIYSTTMAPAPTHNDVRAQTRVDKKRRVSQLVHALPSAGSLALSLVPWWLECS